MKVTRQCKFIVELTYDETVALSNDLERCVGGAAYQLCNLLDSALDGQESVDDD